jgi:hypothetical protein
MCACCHGKTHLTFNGVRKSTTIRKSSVARHRVFGVFARQPTLAIQSLLWPTSAGREAWPGTRLREFRVRQRPKANRIPHVRTDKCVNRERAAQRSAREYNPERLAAAVDSS